LIFVFLFVLLKIVSFAYILNVVELLLVELKADRVVRPHCLSPQHKVFEGGDLETEDIVGDVGLKVVEESEVFADLQLSPLLVDFVFELLDDLQLHHEELLIIGVNEPLARSLVVEVERGLLIFLLPFQFLLSYIFVVSLPTFTLFALISVLCGLDFLLNMSWLLLSLKLLSLH
jgi:hypothetical protein